MIDRRAKIQVTDVVAGGAVAIASYGLYPIYTDLIGRVSASADPLSELMLELVVPFLFLGIMISFGVSARRR